jgi:hypothetical protein
VDGLRKWADVTATCLALRRAALRAMHPRLTAEQIEKKLRSELARAQRRSLDAYRRNA